MCSSNEYHTEVNDFHKSCFCNWQIVFDLWVDFKENTSTTTHVYFLLSIFPSKHIQIDFYGNFTSIRPFLMSFNTQEKTTRYNSDIFTPVVSQNKFNYKCRDLVISIAI